MGLFVEVDRSNSTYTVKTSTGQEVFGNDLVPATNWTSLMFGDLREATGAGVDNHGQGEAYWDDIQVRSLNKHPVVSFASTPPENVAANFTLAGTVVDEFQDPVTMLEFRVGDGDWSPIPKQRFWETEIDVTGLTNGTKYWMNVRAVDGDRLGTVSTLVCYDVSGGSCPGGATEGQRTIPVGKFRVAV